MQTLFHTNRKLTLFLFLLGGIVSAQTTPTATRSTTADQNQSEVIKRTNIVVVPIYPTLFNVDPDVSKAMNNESGVSFTRFRDMYSRALADQLRRELASSAKVISLLDDTVKMKADLKLVYGNTNTLWTLTTDPLNPSVAAPTSKPAAVKSTTGIKNGQVQAASAEGDRFMNTQLLNSKPIDLLKTKYKADYVIFINEVDLRNELGSDPYNTINSNTYLRSATVHFTIFSTATGKRIAAGKSKTTFANTENLPRMIIQKTVPSLTKQIVAKYTSGLRDTAALKSAPTDTTKEEK
jgi:hypothetical protein